MGQIKDKRVSVGLSTTEFAHRLGVLQSTALRLEQSEDADAITLASLKRAATALGLELRYEFIDPYARSRKPPTKRISKRVRISSARRKSSIAGPLSQAVTNRARAMTPQMRLKQACELSDLARELRRV